MWQGKILAAAKGKQGAIVCSVLAQNYGTKAMDVLLRVVFPGYTGLALPGYCAAARIARNGAVCAHMLDKNGMLVRNSLVANSLDELQGDMRRLADEVGLTDAERVEMFAVLQKWIVADFRVKVDAPAEMRKQPTVAEVGHA